ncbi:hypothetical protein B0T16DRAFT_459962 [Cercophora newfieldiana]|uniref:Uncharacterized protein n=1 Tax=Cercophora newfieldiana TaxID=92897 RepID=A0AA40CLZ0_9PEZI|nr:hypothetical protein B0T16DRAFT_459962 [Cercophora newfieldiana]
MKLSIVTLGIAVVGGALAHIEKEFHSDGSISRILSIPDHGITNAISRRIPHQAEEVVTAKGKKGGKSKSKKSTGSKSSRDSGKANRMQQDHPNPHRRCAKCVVKPPPVKPQPTCRRPGGKCNIEDFVKVCCPNKDGVRGCFFPKGNPFDGICQY